MSTIAENLERIRSAKSDIRTAIINQGVDVPEDDRIETYAEKINGIQFRMHTSYGLGYTRFITYDEAKQREILDNIIWDSPNVDALFASAVIGGSDKYFKVGDMTFDFQDITSAKAFLANNSEGKSAGAPKVSVTINNVNQFCTLNGFLKANDTIGSLTINGEGSIYADGLFEDSSVNNVTINCNIQNINDRFGRYSSVQTISDLNITSTQSLNQLFYEMSSLRQVGNVYAPNITMSSYMFRNCGSVRNVGVLTLKKFSYSVFYNSNTVETLSGVVAEEGNISLSNQANLTDESIQSILEHLPTRTESSTLYLNASILAKLTDDQIAIATDKGWTIA